MREFLRKIFDKLFLALFADVFIAAAGVFLSIEGLGGRTLPEWLLTISIILAGVGLFYLTLKAAFDAADSKRIARLEYQNRLSNATFHALQTANDSKTREIMRYTYGKVASWNPINYYKNVLTYDVHEQLRSILIGLKQLVISMDDELNDDMVSIELICCYPNDGQRDDSLRHGISLPLQPERGESHDSFIKRVNKSWKIISSNDSDHGGNVHEFLTDESSFYCALHRKGYIFANDKSEYNKNGNYIMMTNDKTYDYSYADLRRKAAIGSIVGLAFSLDNNEPENICVYAMLTIATFGRKLCESKRLLSDRIEDYHKRVLSSYKALILSEFAQMYIRHEIQNGKRNPVTGEKTTHIYNGNDEASGKKFYNELSEDICKTVNARINKCKYKSKTLQASKRFRCVIQKKKLKRQ